MVLCAYVGDDGQVDWHRDEGTSTFAQIFVRRPANHRYAVVKMRDTYASLDMYEGVLIPVSMSDMSTDKRPEVGIHRHYRTLEAALMATRLMYNIGETLHGKTQEEVDAFIQATQDCPDCQW